MMLINAEQCTRTNKAEHQMMPNKVERRLMMPDNNEQHRTMTKDVEKMMNETPNNAERQQKLHGSTSVMGDG